MRIPYLFIFIILLAAGSRLIPHMPNLAPIAAVAIFGAIYLPKKQAIVVTFGSRIISDAILGFFGWQMMIAVYLAHGVSLGLGLLVKRFATGAISRVGLATVAGLFSAAAFFLITNFAFLYQGYPHNFGGIILSYTNGLPFLRGTLLGDVGYTMALVGGFEAVRWVYSRYQSYKANTVTLTFK